MKNRQLIQALSKRALGDKKENLAAKHLKSQGLKIIERNFNCRFGEIDLISHDGNSLNFTEVRYRRSQSHGGAALSVDHSKQQKLIASAQYYLQCHPKWQSSACRFDVVAIEGEEINWIRDAFQL